MTNSNNTLTDTLNEQIRQQARKLYARDGELEVDDNAPIVLINEACVAEVGCWVWVSNDAAGIASNDDFSDDSRTERYLNAVDNVSTDAEFREDINVSLGDDDGSYVFGWVSFGVDIIGGALMSLYEVDGSEEDIDLWMRAADAYCQDRHGCNGVDMLADSDDACEHLRDEFMSGVSPGKAVDSLSRLQAEEYWHKLGDVPVVEGDRIGSEFRVPTITFKAGTPVTSIWHWFEHYYKLSVACDLMQRNTHRQQANKAA